MTAIGRRAILGGLASLAAACRKHAPAPAPKAADFRRIVSLSPSTTESVFAVKAGDRLVGRSRYCDWPPEVLKLPQVGGYVDPSFEAILALTPDLVVGARGPAGDAITKKLEARGIATYFPETESFAAIDAMIVGIGERVEKAALARDYVKALDQHVERVAEVARSYGRRRVLLVFGLEPLVVAGPGGFPDEMLRRANADNVITEGGAYPTLGVEHVLTLAPDVVVNAAMAESHGKQRLSADTPGWSKVRAVAEGRVSSIEDESVLRPGPRIGQGLLALARAIHPEMRRDRE